MPEELCRERWRQRPRRGVGQRYGGDAGHDFDDAAETTLESDSESDPPLAPLSWSSELCKAVGWTSVFQYSLRRSEHIVTKEARPICTLVRRLAAEVRTGGLRVISFADSSANVGAWAKGRSSSGRLDRHLRQMAPDLVWTDLKLAVPYVPMSANPADAPTRGRATRRAPLAGEPSALAAALLSCSFDDITDAAFAASTTQAKLLDELLEPVASGPYISYRNSAAARTSL